jgi:uracil-DNA glycosylase
MPTVQIKSLPGFEEWRNAARTYLLRGVPPQQIEWRDAQQEATLSLFTPEELSPLLVQEDEDNPQPQEASCASHIRVPKSFLEKAHMAACHNDSQRFALLYRILWRLNHENPSLLHYETDNDILQLHKLVKSVGRDAYKIKAFLRFREVQLDGEAHYISWYEPEHYSLELSLPFFQERFKNMRWSILTPYRSAHWDGNTLNVSDEIDQKQYPTEDTVEAYWLQYYASIFNPARLKTKAMLSQMPKKYWKNMPETVLIEQMIRESGAHVEKMIQEGRSL